MKFIQTATIILYYFLFISVSTLAQVNDPCTVQYSGNSGICKLDTDCPIAVQQIQYGIRPTYCGFINDRVIVCCEGTTGNSEPNDFSFLTQQLTDEDSPPEPPLNNIPAKSKSQQHCENYRKYIQSSVTALPLLPNPDPVTIDVTKCDYNSVPLIVGGDNATAGEFPHMVALGHREDGTVKYVCGGTLISDRYVLTAAHCVRARNAFTLETARLGDLDLHRSGDVTLPPIDVEIEEMIPHPNYKPPAKYNDIALVKLKERVTFNKYVRPACLWNSPNFDRAKTVATGWGVTAFQSQDLSSQLLKVVLDIFPNKKCASYEGYQPNNAKKQLPQGIIASMVCAGDIKEAKDTCQGDSGGPIVVTDKKNQCLFHVIGVTSFGKGCGIKLPAIYTRVSSFVPWIESVVWP